MANQQNSNKVNIPEAKQAMNTMKHEVAGELGIQMQEGYNGSMTSKDAGRIGGNMVKKMIESEEQRMAGKSN